MDQNISRSVTNETKAKFDALLKVALNKNAKNKSKSRQNLIPDSETTNSLDEEEAIQNEDTVELNDESANKKYILNKFLNTTADKEHTLTTDEYSDDVIFIKPPVPKPRRITKQSSDSVSSSQDTYSVKSPVVLTTIEKDSSSNSNKTFIVPNNTEKDDSSTDSERTYEVNKTETIADILIHNSPMSSINKACIMELNTEKDKLESTQKKQHPFNKRRNIKIQRPTKINDDISTNESLSLYYANEKSSGDTIKMLENLEQIPGNHGEINKIQPVESHVQHENEIKPKPKPRVKSKRQRENVEENENRYKYEKIVNIIVHKTDKLDLNNFVVHPVVKVHIVNGTTGEYLKKTDKSRPVIFYLENNNVDYLMPVITQNFNLQKKRSMYPEWEESIIINEDFDYLINSENNVIIFFEILDFLSFSTASLQSADSTRGWHKIAWAFLKVVGKFKILNINKKLRLQLYQPVKSCKEVPNKCITYDWWFTKKLMTYPSTLYITMKAITSPDKVIEKFRSKTPLEDENRSSAVLDNDVNALNTTRERFVDITHDHGDEDNKKKEFLSRLELQICKLPNKLLTYLNSEDEGCFVLKFSNSGQHLACSVLINNMYTIVVYSVLDFNDFYKLPSHQGLIYSINWSQNDSLIISSSADGTVCIWDTRKNFLQMLPHPTYVYCSIISNSDVIATGCYDKILRIWIRSTEEKNEFILHEELEGHKGYITALCFSSSSITMFSSDSVGCIVQWTYNQPNNEWGFSKIIKLPELRDVIINSIILHKKEKRLIVHARDDIIRIIDIKNVCSLHWLEGSLNSRFRILSCLTSCKSYLISGSENGLIHVWNVDTGNLIATYHPYSTLSIRDLPIHCVDFNPTENIMAFCHYGHKVPIIVYTYNQNNTEDQVDFKIFTHEKKMNNRHETRIGDGSHLKPQREIRDDRLEKKVSLKHILEKIDKIIG